MIGVTFHTLDLQSDSIVTTSIDEANAPSSNVDIKDIAESDVSVFIKRRLQPKQITVEGYIQETSSSAIETSLDRLKQALSFSEKDLIVGYSAMDRYYTATPQDVTITRPNGLNRALFAIVFICADPFGTDKDETTMLNDSSSLDEVSFGVTIDGSYKADPTITIDYTVLTGGTAKTVQITNAVTQESMSITRDWLAGDVLTMDSLAKTVFVNSTEVEVDGRYIALAPGSGSVTIADDFTTRTYTIVITYKRRFL